MKDQKLPLRVTILIADYFNGKQSLEFLGVFEYVGHGGAAYKLKVHIKRDSIEYQSYALIKIFDFNDRKWNHLYSISYSKMETVRQLTNGTYLTPADTLDNDDIRRKPFEEDTYTLLECAKTILS